MTQSTPCSDDMDDSALTVVNKDGACRVVIRSEWDVTAAPYCCTIRAKRLVSDCNGGNYTGAYSHIYMTPWTYSGELIRVTNL